MADEISRKTFLKLSGMTGLLMSVPYKKALDRLSSNFVAAKDTQTFISGLSHIGKHHLPNFIDAYFELDTSLNTKDILTNIEGAKGFWDTAEEARRRLVCETNQYKTLLNLYEPGVDALYIGNGINVLGEKGIWLEVEDQNGVVYSSRNAPKKARQNTWRAGLYYYDAHLLDFELADEKGSTLPVKGEIILNCFPDKLHIEALFHVQKDCIIRRAELKGNISNQAKEKKGSIILDFDDIAAGIMGADCQENIIKVSVNEFSWKKGDTHQTYMAFLPGNYNQKSKLETRIKVEANPLDHKNFDIKNGLFKGYDPAKGFYRIQGIPGASAKKGFGGFFDNPNMYLSIDIGIHNNSAKRKIYLIHESPAGPIEAGILTDQHGFPLPIQVQASKNFGGEEEEKIDEPFNESYYPLDLKSDEEFNFQSLHIHQKWGNHTLRQLSSIRFFQIYYHLSQGVTETTCFSLPTKFGSTPSKEARAYTLADYRPLSGQTWSQSPQHHHVALQGWLQYRDKKGSWQYPFYTGTKLLSVGPNLAWFILNYTSSDGKVEQELEFFEMPQTDESRTFLRCRYHFKESVRVQGDMRHNFRLINKGSYIRKVHWNKLTWRDPSGQIKTKAMTHDGNWSAEGIPVRSFNSFFCAYPHIDGNDGLVIRRVGGQVNGKSFQNFGFSAIAYKDGKTELMLVPLINDDTIEAGSSLELDCILMPYGDDSSSYYKPMEESVRFGLNIREYKQLNLDSGRDNESPTVIGPQVQVIHGKKLRDLPPVIKAKNNWAGFTLTGGHNQMSLVITGFKSSKLPMLWKDDAFIDPQVAGGDGYQIMTNADGTYSAVFVIPTWTTRVGHEWKTRSEAYYATQAISEAEIKRISSLNGEVKLKIKGEGKTIIQSPRLWYPAKNSIRVDQPVYAAKSQANHIKTAPIKLIDVRNTVYLDLEKYSNDGFEGQISNNSLIRIECGGLYPASQYYLEIGGDRKKVISSDGGVIEVDIPARNQQRLVCKMVDQNNNEL